jgi:hypothetical protein
MYAADPVKRLAVVAFAACAPADAAPRDKPAPFGGLFEASTKQLRCARDDFRSLPS